VRLVLFANAASGSGSTAAREIVDARFNVDGELCGLGAHVAFSVAPAAFRVVVRR
jgi:hypothetical protein